MDAQNVADRAEVLSSLIEEGSLERLPIQLSERIQKNPIFELLSTLGTQNHQALGVQEELVRKARVVLESFYLAPPSPAQTALSGVFSATPLFADPNVDYHTDGLRMDQMLESFMILDVEKTTAETTMANEAKFKAGISYMVNPPPEPTPQNPKFPVMTDFANQDSMTERQWLELYSKSAITRVLCRQPEDEDDFQSDWYHVFTLCSQSKVTPILVFKHEIEFSIWKEKMNHFHGRPQGADFICLVAPLASEEALYQWSRVASMIQTGLWRATTDQLALLIKELVHLSEISNSKYFTVMNVTDTDSAASLIPCDLTLTSLAHGPWSHHIQARRLVPTSPSEMLLEFQNAPVKHPYSLQFEDPFNLPEPLRRQSRDPVEVQMAMATLQESDQTAANHLQTLFQRAFQDESYSADERWDCFYDHILFMQHRNPTHNSPPPEFSRCPIPVFFKGGRVLKNIFTRKPSFSQSMMFSYEDRSVISPNSPLPLLCARVLEMQRSLKRSGQIPVTLSPSLKVIMGMNSALHTSVLRVDWKKWEQADADRARSMRVCSSYRSLSELLPWEFQTSLDAIQLAPERDFQGLWRTVPSEEIELIFTLLSPPAISCRYTEKWAEAAARSYQLNLTSIKYMDPIEEDWEFLGDLLNLINLK